MFSLSSFKKKKPFSELNLPFAKKHYFFAFAAANSPFVFITRKKKTTGNSESTAVPLNPTEPAGHKNDGVWIPCLVKSDRRDECGQNFSGRLSCFTS